MVHIDRDGDLEDRQGVHMDTLGNNIYCKWMFYEHLWS